jgi:hypothetical protein
VVVDYFFSSAETSLQFNLPSASDIGNKCQTAGDWVVWFLNLWVTPDSPQTTITLSVWLRFSADNELIEPPGVDVGMDTPKAPSAPKMTTSAAAPARAAATGSGMTFNSDRANTGRRRARIPWN